AGTNYAKCIWGTNTKVLAVNAHTCDERDDPNPYPNCPAPIPRVYATQVAPFFSDTTCGNGTTGHCAGCHSSAHKCYSTEAAGFDFTDERTVAAQAGAILMAVGATMPWDNYSAGSIAVWSDSHWSDAKAWLTFVNTSPDCRKKVLDADGL